MRSLSHSLAGNWFSHDAEAQHAAPSEPVPRTAALQQAEGYLFSVGFVSSGGGFPAEQIQICLHLRGHSLLGKVHLRRRAPLFSRGLCVQKHIGCGDLSTHGIVLILVSLLEEDSSCSCICACSSDIGLAAGGRLLVLYQVCHSESWCAIAVAR
jgi:hypothetical protein